MIAQIKVLANFKELEENQREREKEEDSMGKSITPKLKEEYKYVPFLFKLDKVERAYFSADKKDMVLGFSDSDFTVKADDEIWELLCSKINN